MALSRRIFLKSSGLAMLGLGFSPAFLTRAAAQTKGTRGKVLVVVFQRGGADGLSMIPPVGDPAYYAARPDIALPRPGEDGEKSALRLDGTFGLHPALAPLLPFWESGALAVVHGAGMPQSTRSHFDAQDFMESGTPGMRAGDGWLNRAVLLHPSKEASAFRAVAFSSTLPRSLVGVAPAVAMGSLQDFRIRLGGGAKKAVASFEGLYAGAVDEALRSTGSEAFDALKSLDEDRLAKLQPENGARYPNGPLGKKLKDIARLIRADVGLEVAATESGGWDSHINQGTAQGQLANRFKELGESLAAFATDLGPMMSEVCVVTMTEFGRTVRQNGNRGTDHGTGSVMTVLGGAVKGRRVLGRFDGLEKAKLFEDRDLPGTTDYRAVLAEVLQRHLGLRGLEGVFPRYRPERVGLFAL